MAKVKTELQASGNETTLLDALQQVRADMAALKKREDAIKADIFAVFGDQIAQAHNEKGDVFGAVSFVAGNAKVTFTTPKKVMWDQAILADIHRLGGPVEVEYNVPEAVFKLQDQDGRDALMAARTVTPGTVAIKIEGV